MRSRRSEFTLWLVIAAVLVGACGGEPKGAPRSDAVARQETTQPEPMVDESGVVAQLADRHAMPDRVRLYDTVLDAMAKRQVN